MVHINLSVNVNVVLFDTLRKFHIDQTPTTIIFSLHIWERKGLKKEKRACKKRLLLKVLSTSTLNLEKWRPTKTSIFYVHDQRLACFMPHDHLLPCPWWSDFGSWRKPWNIEPRAQELNAYKRPINQQPKRGKKDIILNSHAIILLLNLAWECFLSGTLMQSNPQFIMRLFDPCKSFFQAI